MCVSVHMLVCTRVYVREHTTHVFVCACVFVHIQTLKTGPVIVKVSLLWVFAVYAGKHR